MSIHPLSGVERTPPTHATAADVTKAVAAARAAAPQWAARSTSDRLKELRPLLSVLSRRADEWTERLSADTGKPWAEALLTELLSLPLFYHYYQLTAPLVLRRKRVHTLLPLPGRTTWEDCFPMGVIGIIAPWNFPFQLAVIPALTALIAGNTVVLKPSEMTPDVARIIDELFKGADLPEGVITVIEGDGSTGAALCNAEIDKIFFTGSVATGRKVMAAAATRPIPVELELGGKDAFVVCSDANLRRAARAAVWGGLLNSGQMCISVERILVVDEVHDRFVAMLEEELLSVSQGPPESESDIGAMTTSMQRDIVRSQLADALADGAELRAIGGLAHDQEHPPTTMEAIAIALGERASSDHDSDAAYGPSPGPGLFQRPVLLTGVTPDMRISREETFGPVLAVTRVADEDHAIALANDCEFGLTASVWTSNAKRGLNLASRIEAGQVMVNDVVLSVGHPALPFGGVRSSGLGRYHGREGLLSFVHKRAILAADGKADRDPHWFPYRGARPWLSQTLQALTTGKPGAALDSARGLWKRLQSDRES